uniref:Uncharacterized protein n=1 Tax=Avena sativa TaxID=4498 RepID=A0ACD6AI47_AVESA
MDSSVPPLRKEILQTPIAIDLSSMDGAVRSVWAYNFAAESAVFHQVAPRATHVALNVQYPGCVVRDDGRNHYKLTAEERYQIIRANVAMLRPLQVGIAIRTNDGRRFAWEFNLRGFDIASPHEARDPKSISYLAGCGVDFIRLSWAGIDGFRLRWLLRDSGLFRARASWATFAGAYHVAYFVSMMFGETLPADVDTFMGMVRKLFRSPSVYDVKRLAKEHDKKCVGSLVDIAKQLAVVLPNEGDWRSKPAGRGSMLALLAFETLKQKLGANTEKYRDELCGIQVI